MEVVAQVGDPDAFGSLDCLPFSQSVARLIVGRMGEHAWRRVVADCIGQTSLASVLKAGNRDEALSVMTRWFVKPRV